MIESDDKLLLGLFTGIIFGVFLHKGRVAKLDVIVGAFLLRDFTAVKIMATAAAVGSVGVYFLVDHGYASLHLKEAELGGIVLGGILFGIGTALFGYCPGTGVAASGAGHKDAMVGVVGMIIGALAYVYTFPTIESVRNSFPDFGKVTLPQVTDSSSWVWAIGFVLIVAASSFYAKSRKRNSHQNWRRDERYQY